MAARQEVTFVISARNKTRAVFRAVRDQVKNLGKRLLSLRTLLAGGLFAGLAKGAIDTASALKAAAENVGIAIPRLSALQIQAKAAGQSAGSLTRFLLNLGRRAGEAATGNKTLQKAFSNLLIPVEELKEIADKPEKILLRVALAGEIAAATGQLDKFRANLGKIGEGVGLKFQAFLQQGPAAIIEESRRLIDTTTAKTTKATLGLEKVGRKFDETFEKVGTSLANAFVNAGPVLIGLADALNRFTSTFKGVIKVIDQLFNVKPEPGKLTGRAGTEFGPPLTELPLTETGFRIALDKLGDGARRDAAKQRVLLAGILQKTDPIARVGP